MHSDVSLLAMRGQAFVRSTKQSPRDCQWTPDRAEALARSAGIGPLTEQHWRVLAITREETARTGTVPPLERLIELTGFTAAVLTKLFPPQPLSMIKTIAGLSES